MNIEEVSKTINYLLDTNLKLVENGQYKLAINLAGHAGIGKTAILRQIAEARGAKFTRLDMASLEELGDLLGIPVKSYTMINPEGEEKQVVEKVVPEYINLGYKLCPDCDPIMTYSIPEWVPTDPEQESILVLDDFLRASPLFMNATMALVQFGEYVSWKLPKKTHLILTSNPSSSSYNNISELDSAQQSRMITFNVEFDVKPFAKWMEMQNMESTFINFALMTPEIFDRSEIINARSYTMFANALSGITNLDTPDNLALMSLIAKGCFGDEDGVVSGLLTQFVHNHLDKLITPEDILKKDWNYVKTSLQSVLKSGNEYRSDIAATLTLRFINYIEKYFSQISKDEAKKSDIVINRIIELATSDDHLLSEDLVLKLVKTVYENNKARLAKLFANAKLRSLITLC